MTLSRLFSVFWIFFNSFLSSRMIWDSHLMFFAYVLIFFAVIYYIRHLYNSHNATCLPPKIFISIVFNFSWDVWNNTKILKNKGYAKFWGANKVYYGRCADGESSPLSMYSRDYQPLYRVFSHEATADISVFQTNEKRPCWCSKPILWELNSFLL